MPNELAASVLVLLIKTKRCCNMELAGEPLLGRVHRAAPPLWNFQFQTDAEGLTRWPTSSGDGLS